jgi:hypothetical protein
MRTLIMSSRPAMNAQSSANREIGSHTYLDSMCLSCPSLYFAGPSCFPHIVCAPGAHVMTGGFDNSSL